MGVYSLQELSWRSYERESLLWFISFSSAPTEQACWWRWWKGVSMFKCQHLIPSILPCHAPLPHAMQRFQELPQKETPSVQISLHFTTPCHESLNISVCGQHWTPFYITVSVELELLPISIKNSRLESNSRSIYFLFYFYFIFYSIFCFI